MAVPADSAPVRLAELLATLSLAVDFGLGRPAERLLHTCRIALRLARASGFGERERADTCYVTLLAWLDSDGRVAPLVAADLGLGPTVSEAVAEVGGLRRATTGGASHAQLANLAMAMTGHWRQGSASSDGWDELIAGEPGLRAALSGDALDAVLAALSGLVDRREPFSVGHAQGVADLACAAARRSGFSEGELRDLRRAALIHDLGRLGVPAEIWMRPGRLAPSERERVRMHPYYTLRMFGGLPALSGAAELAASHAERLDGSGYPRGLDGSALSPTARLLAAADVCRSLREARPHREPLPRERVVKVMRSEVSSGHLDGEAVAAVLGAGGEYVRRRRAWPADLTAREVEVLALLAQGDSNKAIAARLFISAKTVSNHVEHIYTKIGASSRTEASLFAVRHGLAQPRFIATAYEGRKTSIFD